MWKETGVPGEVVAAERPGLWENIIPVRASGGRAFLGGQGTAGSPVATLSSTTE
jgi:hypothetical protein